MAGGLIFALAHDFRFACPDKLFFQLNEVDMGVKFSPGMNAIVK
jgi:hypothetical protein